MRSNTIHTGTIAGLAVLCLLLAMGCSRVSDDQREARDRNLRRAAVAKEAQDIDQAIVWCERALERRPQLALAHRELALMLDNYRQDYVAALYHYQRYLQLRPDAENRETVEDLIRHCRVSFAAQIASSPEELKRALQARDTRIRQLELELATYRETSEGDKAFRMPPSVARPADSKKSPATASDAIRIHVVEAGENLATISMRYYGTPSRWKNIFNANEGRLTDANNVRIGTRLEIPNL